MDSGRRKTLKNRVTFVIALFSSLIILSVIVAQGYSLYFLNRQIAETYGVLAEKLGEDLNARMMDLEEYCRNITYTSWFYKSLLSSSPSSSFRLQSEHELMQMMKNKVTSTDRIHSLNVIDVREERIYSVMKTPDTDFMYELKRRVCDVPFGELCEAAERAAKTIGIPRPGFIFAPRRNEWFAGLPCEAGFAPYSKDKPLMFGSTLGEFPRVNLTEEEKEAMTEEDKLAYLRERYGEKADAIIEAFRKAYPSHKNILDVAYTDVTFRPPTQETALMKAALSPDNTWIYLCSYNCPEDGWVPMWHGGDVGYAFMNEDRVYVLNEAIYGQKMSQIFSTMFLNYIKTGDPNNNYLPKWEPITPEHHYTMVIDRESELREAHDEELIRLVQESGRNSMGF